MKLGDKRVSRYCRCTKPTNCADVVESRLLNGKRKLAWVVKCKTLNSLANKARKSIN